MVLTSAAVVAVAVAACVGQFECRRVLLLKYFDEPFPVEACGRTCDNCRGRDNMTMQASQHEGYLTERRMDGWLPLPAGFVV